MSYQSFRDQAYHTNPYIKLPIADQLELAFDRSYPQLLPQVLSHQARQLGPHTWLLWDPNRGAQVTFDFHQQTLAHETPNWELQPRVTEHLYQICPACGVVICDMPQTDDTQYSIALNAANIDPEAVVNTDCPICLEAVPEEENGTYQDPEALPCGHKYHLKCLYRHLHQCYNNKRTPFCPYCRTDIQKDALISCCVCHDSIVSDEVLVEEEEEDPRLEAVPAPAQEPEEQEARYIPPHQRPPADHPLGERAPTYRQLTDALRRQNNRVDSLTRELDLSETRAATFHRATRLHQAREALYNQAISSITTHINLSLSEQEAGIPPSPVFELRCISGILERLEHRLNNVSQSHI